MKKIHNSNFELIQDVIGALDFHYVPEKVENEEKLIGYWIEVVGKKISKFSKVLNFSDDNILIIVCADSFVANELYLEKKVLLEKMNAKVKELGIIIKDIRFDYKKWKNNDA